MRIDNERAECREGRFPIGVLEEPENQAKRAKK
jgi:hypothetical protein